MNNKYDCFFESIKDFLIKLDLVNKKKGIVSEEDNSCVFVDFLGKKPSKSIKSYLKYFGTDIEFKNNGIGNALFNLVSISNCTKVVESRNIKDKILKVEVVGDWEEKVANFENQELLFLKYDTISSSFLFVINSVNNPVMYVYWEGGEITSDNINFTSFVRDTVFWELLRLVKNPSNQIINNRVHKIEWIKFYEFLFQNYKNIRNKIISWRYEFNYNLLGDEKENHSIFGVDEFEIKFIKFILKEKKIDYHLSHFNPYSFNKTFKTYLP